MKAFEIGHLGRISGFDQRFEAGLDQMGDPAAQHGLFTEQIGFALFLEIGFDDARPAAANRARIGQGQLFGEAVAARLARFLVHRDEAGYAAALDVFAAHRVTRPLGRDHDDVDIGGRVDQPEMDVETVREGERSTRAHPARDFIGVDRCLVFIGREDHQHVGPFGGFGNGLDRKARTFGFLRAGGAIAQRNGEFAHTAIA